MKKNFDNFADLELKEGGSSKYILSKFDYELFDEASNKPEKIVRVKKYSSPNNGQKWKLFVDNKVIFVVDGAKISKKEKTFLQTVEGVNFLLNQCKQGIKSLNCLRVEMKKIIK